MFVDDKKKDLNFYFFMSHGHVSFLCQFTSRRVTKSNILDLFLLECKAFNESVVYVATV